MYPRSGSIRGRARGVASIKTTDRDEMGGGSIASDRCSESDALDRLARFIGALAFLESPCTVQTRHDAQPDSVASDRHAHESLVCGTGRPPRIHLCPSSLWKQTPRRRPPASSPISGYFHFPRADRLSLTHPSVAFFSGALAPRFEPSVKRIRNGKEPYRDVSSWNSLSLCPFSFASAAS